MAEKICDVRNKLYIALGTTVSFIDFFGVSKTIDTSGRVTDIRMVYNGTSYGLNDCVWAPNFWLPTPQTAARQLDCGYYMINLDLREFFLNFLLHQRIQPHTGVDLSVIKREVSLIGQPVYSGEQWTRLLMEFCSSPYMAGQFYYLAEEVILGNTKD